MQIASKRTTYVCSKCPGYGTCKKAHFHSAEVKIERERVSSEKKKRATETQERAKELQARLTPRITKGATKKKLKIGEIISPRYLEKVRGIFPLRSLCTNSK